MKKIILFFIVLQSMAFAYDNVQSKVYYYKTVHDEYDRDKCYAVSEDLENRLSELNIDGLSSSAYIHKGVRSVPGAFSFRMVNEKYPGTKNKGR